MSVRRVADIGFSLPPNSSYIDFPRTDGNMSTWPPNATRVVDHEGHVNFYEQVDADHMQNKKWRVAVGDAVSLKLKMPEGPKYVLRSFPDGYRLYDHNKGPANAPRHDLYLFGPMKKRFRSINEFIPHAIWLMGDPGSDCECKYCAKKSQRDITASMSSILRVTPTQSPAPSRIKPMREKGKARDPMTRLREARQRDTRTYASIQKSVKPLKASSSVLKQPMLVERSNDLRAIYSKTSMNIRRWFREGEVVWCALERPISGPGIHGDILSIDYWPAVVDEVKLKSQPIPRESTARDRDSSSQPHIPQASSSSMQIDSEPTENGKGPTLAPNDEPLPWTIRQSTRYKVHFLAVSHSMTIDDDKVLPYQASMPSNELIELMVNHPPERLKFDKNIMSTFNPCPAGTPPVLSDAIPAYALAIQIASSMSSYWCLTDEYELKYTIPPSSSISASQPRPSLPSQSASSQLPSSSQMPPPPTTLQAAIEAAGRHNAQVSNPQYYGSASAVHPSISFTDAHETTSRMVGMPPPPNQLSQTRFQGLWWGAERIWVDDFIRLKIPRRSLAPNGENHIVAPSGPGKSDIESWSGQPRDPEELGAGMRGVFLRLDGIIVVDIEVDGKTKMEARMCGRLYELAGEDWNGVDFPHKTSPTRDPIMSTNGLPRPLGSSPGIKSSSQPDFASQNDALSGPADSATRTSENTNSGPPMANILPQAPIGYKFRPILEPGYEFVGAMGLLSGRYYPNVLQHPRMRARVETALHSYDIEGNSSLWALEGLAGGYFNSVDPCRYKKSRVAMMQDADKDAVAQLEGYAQQRMAEERARHGGGDGEDAMEIDDIYA